MKKLKKWIKNKWFRRFSFVIIGALCGFAYYYFVGCTTNTCPITSNPYISIGYGALIGTVVSIGGKKQETSKRGSEK